MVNSPCAVDRHSSPSSPCLYRRLLPSPMPPPPATRCTTVRCTARSHHPPSSPPARHGTTPTVEAVGSAIATARCCPEPPTTVGCCLPLSLSHAVPSFFPSPSLRSSSRRSSHMKPPVEPHEAASHLPSPHLLPLPHRRPSSPPPDLPCAARHPPWPSAIFPTAKLAPPLLPISTFPSSVAGRPKPPGCPRSLEPPPPCCFTTVAFVSGCLHYQLSAAIPPSLLQMPLQSVAPLHGPLPACRCSPSHGYLPSFLYLSAPMFPHRPSPPNCH